MVAGVFCWLKFDVFGVNTSPVAGDPGGGGEGVLKEEALDYVIWRARFGRGLGPVVRQTTK
jgi:hypothetical protein